MTNRSIQREDRGVQHRGEGHTGGIEHESPRRHEILPRAVAMKASIARRQTLADAFAIWWQKHQDRPVAIRELHEDVRQVLDPQGRGRQYLAACVERLAGTRMVGFVFTRQSPAGKWGATTYALKKTDADQDHGGHRGHRTDERRSDAPYAPDAGVGRYTTKEPAASAPPMAPMAEEDPFESRPNERPGFRMRI
jgi:hypothetical protein